MMGVSTTPGDIIRALVCGLPSTERRNRRLMALQAFLDDSGSTKGPTFVLAGFIASHEQWERFADAWAETLAEPPTVRFYKNSQAMSQKDEFDGWSYVDIQKKISDLISVIIPYVTHRVSVSINHEEFSKFLRVNDVAPLSDPYYLLFMAMIGMVIIGLDREGETAPISFVFDEQGHIGFKALEMVRVIKQNAHLHFTSSQSKLLVGLPTFADDKRMMPLQAADLYAGNVRRFYIDNKKLYMPLRQHMRELSSIPSFSKTLNAHTIGIRAARKLLYFLPPRASDDDD